ncbi:MAG: filamentous hemagglutinin N-terminal domain-containing protein, partial [Paracraurococcus sp.]
MVKLPLLRSALLVTTALVVPPAARAGGPQQGGAGLPQGGQFVAGSGRIAAGAGALTVTQSSRTGIVDWRSFSIGAGQRVQVNNGTGATLNRVTGNRPSAIAGTLAATGSVYLVNPQGIVVTPQGKVITGGGFVASTRPADAAGFMQSGTLALSGAGPGTVVNRGTIVAGGSVVLHGAEVANSGTVQAGGQAVLAASKDLVLRPVGDTARVVVRGAAGDVRNEGRIEAAEVALRAVGGNVYALAGNRDGYLRATGTVAREGRVLLVAGGDVQADAPIIADGEKGGSVTVRAGGTARVSGSVSARGSAGQGGRVTVSGQVVAVSGTARIDASGATQGGDVQIGGKPPGKAAAAEPASRRAVPNATETRIDDGARIVADGGKGSGGQIIVWSDQRTTFGGTLSARGGTDGGMAEVSSAGVLDYRGRADLRGGTGRAGTLLLDPTDVMITTGNVPAGVSRIDPAVIADQLIYSNFTLVTGAGEGAGDITVASPLTWISTNTLTLSAYRSINVNAGLTNLHGGSLVLQSDSTGTGTGTVAFGQGGSVKLVGGSTTLLYNPYSYATPTDYSRFVKGGLLPEMLVNTPAQLAAMAGAPNAAYALGRDIDLEGSDFAGVAQFGGLLDGRGHTIRNFTTDTVSEAGAGLFGFLTETASIRDLRMTNAAVYGPGVAGLLAATNAGSIRGVSLEGTVAAGGVAGGVAGLNTGTIAEASVNASVTAGQVAGGIVGWNSGSISNATAAGTVGGSSTVGGGVGSPYGTVGGSVGSPYGTVGKTTAVGTVRSTSTVGGVVGSNDGIIGNTNPNDTVGGSSMVGGIAGISTGAIASVYASNTVSGAGVTGAVLGRNLGTLTAGYAAGGATIPGGASDVTSVPITDTVGTAPLPTTITPGTLPSGFNATAWYVSTAGTPALRNVPEATPYLRLAGQVYSADGTAAPGVPLTIMVDRAFFAGVASDATGTWSLEARGAAEGYNVLALLPSGPLGNTVGTRISQSIDTLDIAPETLRFISGSSAPITTSDLLQARSDFIRPLGRARSLLIPITVSTIYGVVDLGDVDLRMTSPGSFLLDRSYNTSGTMTIDVGGTVTQISPLLVGGLEIKAGGMVTLTNPDNRIRAIEGSAGGIDIVTAGPLDIGPAGLSSSGLASLRVAERLTLYGPLVGSGESLTVQAGSLASVGVTDPFRAGGGGTWRIVLADRGTDPPV